MQIILRDQRRFITVIILLLIAGLASAQDSLRKMKDSTGIEKYYKPCHLVWITPTNARSINGVVNLANKGVGIQIGLINRYKNLKGLQLGLWNISGKRGLPVINWGT